MRLIVMTIAAIAISGAGGAAFAQSPAATNASAAKPEASQKVVCKSQRFVGSHMSERICKTRSEWAEGTDRTKRWLDKNNGKLFNDQLIKGEGGGMHISISTPGERMPH